MTSEYAALKRLENNPDFQVLRGLWAHQLGKIVNAMRTAGKRGTESAWRYYAGQQEGFELAVTQLERALAEMERQKENAEEKTNVDQIIEGIRKLGDQPS